MAQTPAQTSRTPRPTSEPAKRPTAHGTHDHDDDPRNADILIRVNDDLLPRAQAAVSVFDSGFILGDGIWEGIRVHHGRMVFLDQHLDRLYAGAKAIDLDIGRSRDELTAMLEDTLAANEMTDGVHIRLMVSRGVKSTPYQDPRFTIGAPTIVIICEYKQARPETLTRGLELFTVHVRRGRPDVQDPKLNTHSKLNCVTACIQAAKAGADEALMLDPHGFVATCNSTHFFIVRDGEVWTSTGDYCLDGITRRNVLRLCEAHGVPAQERNFSLSDVYGADEAFVTGTFAGIAPVARVDGRTMGRWERDGGRGPMVAQLQHWYLDLLEAESAPGLLEAEATESEGGLLEAESAPGLLEADAPESEGE